MKSTRRLLAAQSTVIAALMRRLDVTEVIIGEDAIDDADGVVDLDVTRAHNGDMRLILARFEPSKRQ